MSHLKGLWTLLCLAAINSKGAAAAPSLNASSLSMPYTAPLASATISAASQNASIKYVYGNCANATALSTAYTTISSHNTMILSTIAPSATCCTKCEIGADMVRLVYWQPDPTDSASDSQITPYTLVSDNYTFTSPSVYVIYSTLMAIYDCEKYSVAPNVGSIYDKVTIGYPPDALSTGVCYHTNWRSINYTELYYPPPDYEVITQAACSMDYGDPRTIDSSHILAGSPIFSIPGGVSQVDPLWSTCTPADPGGYDPPRVLTKTGNLVPTPTPPPVTQAKPEPSVTLQFAVETGAPSTANGANVESGPQDTSNPVESNSQDPGAFSSPGVASGGDSSPTKGKQGGDSGSQQAPGAKENQPDPQNPGTSNDPSVGKGGNSGTSPQENTGDTVPGAPMGKASGSDPQDPSTSSTPSVGNGGISGSNLQDNGGNVGSGSAQGSKANGADPKDSGVPNAPGSPSKEDPSSVSPANDSAGGSEIGASLYEAPGGGLQLGTVTIAPGAQTTHSGHIFSVGSSFVLVDGTSFDLQPTASGAAPGLAHTGVPSQQDGSDVGVIVGTTTFRPGAQTTYSGHTMSVGSNIFAVDGTSYSEATGGGLILGSMTLPPGARTTQSGHVISVGSSSVVIDGTSYTWAVGASSEHTVSVGSNIFAVDGTSYSEATGGGLILGSMTLPPGTRTTQSGHVISVGSSSVVIDGTSYTWAAGASSPTSTPASDNLGGLIMSAFGTGAAANSSSSPLAFTGDAARLQVLARPGLLAKMATAYIMYIYIL